MRSGPTRRSGCSAFGRNAVGDAGATSLAEALRVNTALTGLDLCGNAVGDAGAIALAGAIGVNATLTYVALANNRIAGAGTAALETAIAANPRTLGPLTAAQRLAFVTGHLHRPSQRSPVAKLPLDMVRRILTQYMVGLGVRRWNGHGMETQA
jgi:hypothetical protein